MLKIIQPKNIKKIVIFRTDRIGEVLLASVCIDALKGYFPDVSITFVTSEYAKDIISGRSDLDEVATWIPASTGMTFFKLISFLKSRKFDLAVVLNPHKILHIGCFLAGVKYRLGYSRKWGFCLTHKIKDEKAQGKKHEVEYNLDLLKAIGVRENIIAPHLTISKESSDYIDDIIKNLNLNTDKPLVCIQPGSSNPKKRWLPKNFTELIKKIKSDLDCNIALLGSKEDKELIEQVLLECKDMAFDLSGAFTIKQLAAFLKRAKLFIGNDCGPMHIAAALGVPVIALFGSASNPRRWHPWGQGHTILHKDDINAITVSEVAETVTKAKRKTYP